MNPARDLGPRLVTLCTGWGGAALSSWCLHTLGIGTGLGFGLRPTPTPTPNPNPDPNQVGLHAGPSRRCRDRGQGLPAPRLHEDGREEVADGANSLCPHLTPARATTDLCSSECYRECTCQPASACVCLLSAMDPCASSDMLWDVYGIRSYSCVDTHAFCGGTVTKG